MISEFIRALKTAYKEIYAEKINAKSVLKDMRSLEYEWRNRITDILQIVDTLERHWDFLPVKSRKDFLKKTHNFIYNGSSDLPSLREIYEGIHYAISKDLKSMEESYKEKNYKNVYDIYMNSIAEINEIMIEHGIDYTIEDK